MCGLQTWNFKQSFKKFLVSKIQCTVCHLSQVLTWWSALWKMFSHLASPLVSWLFLFLLWYHTTFTWFQTKHLNTSSEQNLSLFSSSSTIWQSGCCWVFARSNNHETIQPPKCSVCAGNLHSWRCALCYSSSHGMWKSGQVLEKKLGGQFHFQPFYCTLYQQLHDSICDNFRQ